MTFVQTCEAALKAKGLSDTADVTTASIRLINKLARDMDQPHRWPYIDAAPKAIRWYSRVFFRANGPCSNYEYILGLEQKIGDIVNGR
jgi:hypothetical protein